MQHMNLLNSYLHMKETYNLQQLLLIYQFVNQLLIQMHIKIIVANLMIKLKVVGPAQADTIFYDPSFFKDTYSSYNVRQAVGLAVEQVVLNGVSPEQAIEEALNSLK